MMIYSSCLLANVMSRLEEKFSEGGRNNNLRAKRQKEDQKVDRRRFEHNSLWKRVKIDIGNKLGCMMVLIFP